ncbi:MAG: hypothetical protein RIT19_2351 [Verrucomicrobiota bacterium]
MSDTTPHTRARAEGTLPRRRGAAWQPFSGGGISRFAEARAGRTIAFLTGFALTTALVLGWALHTAWWPVLDRAILEFPEQGVALRGGRLTWPESGARLLADSPHLGVAVQPGDHEALGRTADLQLELLPGSLRLAGIAGFVELPWPTNAQVPLGRVEARAGWEAWRRPVLGAVIASATAAMLVVWSLWTLILAPVVRVVALLSRRRITLGGCWRLGAAACMGASPVLALGLAGYVMRWIPWPALAAVVAAHLLIAGLQLCWGLANRPRSDSKAPSDNPFQPGAKASAPRGSRDNPFG